MNTSVWGVLTVSSVLALLVVCVSGSLIGFVHVRAGARVRTRTGGALLLLLLTTGVATGIFYFARPATEQSGMHGHDAKGAEHYSLTPQTSTAPPRASVAEAEFADGIRLIYFHRTLRCPTCLAIETLAQAAVHEHFADALAAGRVEWRAVNIELPGNEHFERELRLQSQSLVVLEFVRGEPVRWKILPEVWDLVEDELAFNDYIRRELLEFGAH